MLTRVHQAQDWDSGIELSKHLLGKLVLKLLTVVLSKIFERKVINSIEY